jgi:YD repeat-containing protein
LVRSFPWKRKSSGHVITIATRDAQHRVTQISFPAAGGGGGFSVSTVYDEFGRVKSTTDNTGTTNLAYDVLNRVTQVAPPSPQKTLDFSYSPDVTLQRWTTNVTLAGVGTYQYREDTKGRLYQVQNAFSQLFQQEYDLDGKPTLTTWPNGVTASRSYFNRDWLQQIQLRKADTSLLNQFTYAYTLNPPTEKPTGRVRQETDLFGNAHVFAYNDLYELVSESHPDFGTPGTIAYTYDPNGNRTSRSKNGVIDYYGIGAGNRLLWVNRGTNAAPTAGQTNPYTLFSYNTNGVLSQRDRRYDSGLRQVYDFLWDADDRLRTVQEAGTTRFSALYNGDGIRVQKSDTRSGTLQSHNYSYGPGGLMHEDNPTTVYTPGFGHRSNGISSFYQTDWLGNTR